VYDNIYGRFSAPVGSWMPVKLFFNEISTLQTMTRLIIYRPSPVRTTPTLFLSADILIGEGLRYINA
jgi:hypothetical protein